MIPFMSPKLFRYDPKNWNQFPNTWMDEYSNRRMWIHLHSQYEYLCHQSECSNIDSLYDFEANETGDWQTVIGQ